MKEELYAELRALVLAHQGGETDRWHRSAACGHCEGRWQKIKGVLGRIVDNAEAIREDMAAERAETERIRQVMENLPVRPLRPRRRA